VYLNKQIPVDMDTIVSVVIQSQQMSEGGALSVSPHVNLSKFEPHQRLFLLEYETLLSLIITQVGSKNRFKFI